MAHSDPGFFFDGILKSQTNIRLRLLSRFFPHTFFTRSNLSPLVNFPREVKPEVESEVWFVANVIVLIQHGKGFYLTHVVWQGLNPQRFGCNQPLRDEPARGPSSIQYVAPQGLYP